MTERMLYNLNNFRLHDANDHNRKNRRPNMTKQNRLIIKDKKTSDYKTCKTENLVWKVAVFVEPIEDGTLRIAFRLPNPILVSTIFDRLRGTLFYSYKMVENIMTNIVNGKCYRSWIVSVNQPYFQRLSLSEWPVIVKNMMEQRFHCNVTCFENYEKFINA